MKVNNNLTDVSVTQREEIIQDEFRIRPIDGRQVTKRIRIALLDFIKNSAHGDTPFKLPNEDKLAQMLGASRTGLRDALTVMESEGYITRRRGIGTLVNPKIARSRTRLDIQTELSGLISSQGYKTRLKTVTLELINQPIDLFEEEKVDKYLLVRKIFFADEEPAIFCEEYLSGARLDGSEEHVHELRSSNMYEFVKEHLNIQNAYSFSEMEAITAPQQVADHLEIGSNFPLMKLSSRGYDYDHRPYLASYVYIRTDIIQLSLLRKPI